MWCGDVFVCGLWVGLFVAAKSPIFTRHLFLFAHSYPSNTPSYKLLYSHPSMIHVFIIFFFLTNLDIVLFDFSFRTSPQSFRTRLLRECFHTLINGGFFSSPTIVGHHNHPHSFLPPINVEPPPFAASLLAHRLVSTPFGEGREGWHIVQCLALIPFVTTQIHR